MGGAAAGAAAAAVARAQRRVISHFLSQNAVAAANAVPFTADTRIEQRFFDRMREQGVILPGDNAGYYVDAPAYDSYQQARRRMARRALIVVLAVVVIAMLATLIVVRVSNTA